MFAFPIGMRSLRTCRLSPKGTLQWVFLVSSQSLVLLFSSLTCNFKLQNGCHALQPPWQSFTIIILVAIVLHRTKTYTFKQTERQTERHRHKHRWIDKCVPVTGVSCCPAIFYNISTQGHNCRAVKNSANVTFYQLLLLLVFSLFVWGFFCLLSLSCPFLPAFIFATKKQLSFGFNQLFSIFLPNIP